MNARMIELVRAIGRVLPNWVTSAVGVLLGILAGADLLTWEKLSAFVQALTWPDVYNYMVGLLIASGGIKLYSKQPVKIQYVTAEDPVVDLVDQVK